MLTQMQALYLPHFLRLLMVLIGLKLRKKKDKEKATGDTGVGLQLTRKEGVRWSRPRTDLTPKEMECGDCRPVRLSVRQPWICLGCLGPACWQFSFTAVLPDFP